MSAHRGLAAVAVLSFSACTAGTTTPDSGVPDSGVADAGFTDAGPPPPDDGGWRDLFNGTDLTGWQRYLGSPMPGDAPLGLENDPRGVFTVTTVDGEPAIHISGEVWGSLISVQDFGDFELEAQFKWGTHAWPPLGFFDSGLMYLSHGPYGAVNAGGMPLSSPANTGAFMVSMEYQITPGDIGGIYDLGPIGFTAGPRVHAPEVTDGGWSQARIIFRNGMATHFLDDAGVASGSGFVDTWPGGDGGVLTRGRLQLQCEGGEIFFRHVRLRTFN